MAGVALRGVVWWGWCGGADAVGVGVGVVLVLGLGLGWVVVGRYVRPVACSYALCLLSTFGICPLLPTTTCLDRIVTMSIVPVPLPPPPPPGHYVSLAFVLLLHPMSFVLLLHPCAPPSLQATT
jgi:hypothetical protein